ncbi:hypothetical protein [Macrococcus animalis]|uniref:hypothetical protein n=1 Tax=Macrococcus animalis TaxID=3395467 RepID=UPI0039BECCAA
MKTSEKKLTYLKEYRFINRDRLRAYHRRKYQERKEAFMDVVPDEDLLDWLQVVKEERIKNMNRNRRLRRKRNQAGIVNDQDPRQLTLTL